MRPAPKLAGSSAERRLPVLPSDFWWRCKSASSFVARPPHPVAPGMAKIVNWHVALLPCCLDSVAYDTWLDACQVFWAILQCSAWLKKVTTVNIGIHKNLEGLSGYTLQLTLSVSNKAAQVTGMDPLPKVCASNLNCRCAHSSHVSMATCVLTAKNAFSLRLPTTCLTPRLFQFFKNHASPFMCQLCLADRVHDFEEVTPAPTTAQRKDLTVNCTFFMRHAVRPVAIFFGAMDFETDLKIFIDCTTWGTTILPMAGTGEDGEGCFFSKLKESSHRKQPKLQAQPNTGPLAHTTNSAGRSILSMLKTAPSIPKLGTCRVWGYNILRQSLHRTFTGIKQHETRRFLHELCISSKAWWSSTSTNLSRFLLCDFSTTCQLSFARLRRLCKSEEPPHAHHGRDRGQPHHQGHQGHPGSGAHHHGHNQHGQHGQHGHGHGKQGPPAHQANQSQAGQPKLTV